MTVPIKLAHLCGPLGQALAVVNDETWLYEGKDRRRPTANDIHFFFEHGLEVRALDPVKDGASNEDNLVSVLELEARRFQALQGLLIGMDGELDDNLRQKSIRRANRLLANRTIADFIERRFLKPVPHQAWDLPGALRLARAEKLAAVARLYALVDGPLLLRLEDEIAIWGAEQGLSSVERAVIIDKAYDTGLVAALVTALHDGSSSQVRTKVFLAKNIAWDRRLATHLVGRFTRTETTAHPGAASAAKHRSRKKAKDSFAKNDPIWDEYLAEHPAKRSTSIGTSSSLPPSASENDEDEVEATEIDIIAEVKARLIKALDEYQSRHRRKSHRVRGETIGAEALPAVLKQIEWIATRFESGHSHAAWNDVAELTERQLTEADPDKLAMSLTSLATRLAPQEEVASALCDLAVLCAPDDPAVWSARAELLRSWGRSIEALTAYERTVESFPHDAVARNGRAEMLRALGRLDEALAAYERTVENFPENAVARTGRAETLRALGRLDEALAAYERTVEDFPQNAVARNGRAETLRALGRLDEALAAYERTVEDFPQNAFARTGRAETLRALGRLDEALAAYERTVEDFPQDAVARTGRAETLRALGRLDEALAAYERTVENFPQDAVARNGRAETLRALGRLDEALAAYERTVEDFPQDAFARNGRAETLRALDRLDEALAAYERTVEDFPQNAVARNGYAVVLSDLGKFNDARAVLKTVELTPRTVQDWVGLHILCTIDFKEGATVALAHRLEQFAQTCPYPGNRLYFETTLAVVRIALKRMQEARQTLKALVARPELEVGERAALQLMEAHVEAADGDLGAARQSLAAASNVVSLEQFRLRRLRQEIERRFGLGSTPPLTRSEEIAASDKTLVHLEMDFWVERAAGASLRLRRVA